MKARGFKGLTLLISAVLDMIDWLPRGSQAPTAELLRYCTFNAYCNMIADVFGSSPNRFGG